MQTRRTPTAWAGRSEDDHGDGAEQKLQLSDVVTWLGETSTVLRKQPERFGATIVHEGGREQIQDEIFVRPSVQRRQEAT